MQKYFETTWRLWYLLKPFHKHFYLQLTIVILQQIVYLYTIYLTSTIINSIVGSEFNTAYKVAIVVGAVSVLRYIIMYFTDRHSLTYVENGINTFLQEYSLTKILNLNPSQYIEDHSAIKQIVINRGEEAIKMIISTIILTLLPTLTLVIFSVIAIAYFSPLVATITALTFIIATIWTNFFAKYHKDFIRQNTDNWDGFNKIRTESFQHLSLIKNSGAENDYVNKYVSKRKKVVEYDIFVWNKSNINNKARVSFFGISKMFITCVIIYQASIGQLLIGSIFAIWSWMNDAFNSIMNIVQSTRRLPAYYVELDKYLNVIDKVADFEEKGVKKFGFGDIVFQDVVFNYPKSTAPVLHNMNIVIPEGKKTAFVGFSGSGKSTIIKLLLRMYDWTSGDIKIGDKSLRDIDAQVLRQRIGYVEQHVDLFDTTIKDNILFGLKNKKISEGKLSDIIHKSRIDQFFHRLGTTGLETQIGERGVKLSGGERQRIGIARALAKDPDILIFDEATASLDTENEKFIQEAIDESSKGRTTIIIAHRLSTVQNSDLIYVMDKGKIVGSGTHEELKETNPEYQRLIHAQNN